MTKEKRTRPAGKTLKKSGNSKGSKAQEGLAPDLLAIQEIDSGDGIFELLPEGAKWRLSLDPFDQIVVGMFKAPNLFQRLMFRILFGGRWKKIPSAKIAKERLK